MKDIAVEAGVSKVTVSNVINGNYSKVSAEKIEEIKKLIQKYNYVPNSSARALTSKASRIIAIITYGHDNANALENPYVAQILGEITQAVQLQGYYVMLHLISDCRDITKRLRSWNTEGAIFLGMFDDNIQQIHEDNDIPLIFIDSYSSVRQISNVGLDDYKGGALAARYLMECGHKNIAFIGPSLQASKVVQQRMQGFFQTLKKNGIHPNPANIIPEGSEIQMAESVCSLKEPVTAIFTTADLTAVNLINGLRRKKFRVPEDFSVIGFDNLPISRYMTPRLTTISQNIYQKAKIAVEVLFSHIKDPKRPTENIILDVELIERESVRRL